MSGKDIQIGPVGIALAENIRTLRMAHRFGFADFSRRLEEAGRKLPSLSLRRMEEYERRIDVDDLHAIALVLQVRREDLLDGGKKIEWGTPERGGVIDLREPAST